jgi:hypothetical protein
VISNDGLQAHGYSHGSEYKFDCGFRFRFGGSLSVQAVCRFHLAFGEYLTRYFPCSEYIDPGHG